MCASFGVEKTREREMVLTFSFMCVCVCVCVSWTVMYVRIVQMLCPPPPTCRELQEEELRQHDAGTQSTHREICWSVVVHGGKQVVLTSFTCVSTDISSAHTLDSLLYTHTDPTQEEAQVDDTISLQRRRKNSLFFLSFPRLACRRRCLDETERDAEVGREKK